MVKKLLFIFNPIAGKEMVRKDLSTIVETFSYAGFIVTVMPTQKKGDVIEFIKTYANEYDVIVTSGGDGTMNEMANALMMIDTKPNCGYIPTGTVNDFANSLRIPMKLKEAAMMITEENYFNCDLCEFNNNVFSYVAGFGLFTDVSFTTPQDLKNTWGKMAYIFEAIKRFNEYTPNHIKIESEDKNIEDDFILGLISNSEYVAGFDAYSKKNIKMDDGVFEVLLVKKIKNVIEAQSVINALVTRNLHSEYIVRFQSSDVKMTCENDILWTLDGENGGEYKEIRIKNLRRAINIAVPLETLSIKGDQ
jgi:YegS/Rv2252/BmrU family lipid kinase